MISLFIGANFATGRAESGFAGEGDNPFFVTRRADVTGVAALRVAAAHHLLHGFLHVGPLVSRYLFLSLVPPLGTMVYEDLAKAIATVLCRRMKQQDCRRSKGGDGQHSLAGVGKTGILADRTLELLGVVQPCL